jgi:hypothetical protein
LGLILLAWPRPAETLASSDQAWATFRAQVAAACTAAAKKQYANPIVVVDPFGTESYGVALVYARTPVPKNSPPENSLTTAVCVYDKKTQKAELSGAFRTAP